MSETERESLEHTWANNRDPNLHRRRGSVSFSGPAAYSYGTIVAYKHPAKHSGKRDTVLVAGEGIYNTNMTMRHKDEFIQAVDQNLWDIIYVDLPPGLGVASFGQELRSLPLVRNCHTRMREKLKQKAADVRDAGSYPSRATRWCSFKAYLEKVNTLGTFLGRKSWTHERVGLDYDAEEENLARRNKVIEQRWHADEAVREESRAEWKRKHGETPERVESWRRREYTSTTGGWDKVYLRLSRDGTHVETSRGAAIAVEEGRSLFRLIKREKETHGMCSFGRIVKDRGLIGVGPYLLHDVTPNGDCEIGCHTITYEEMEKLATEYEASKQKQGEKQK